VSEVLPGAILIQINMVADGAASAAVGLWNCALRVGGAVDSAVTTSCGSPDPSTCKAAFALLHVSPNASGAYLENVWGWVADHALDHPATAPPQNIAVGRGALVESGSGSSGGGPTWLVGTSFEHATLYQYALRGARDVYLGLHQSETPYWQGKGTAVRAPAPWTVDTAGWGDPDFGNCAVAANGGDGGGGDDDRCYRAWGLYMAQSENVVVHGSAMWAFFNGMNDNRWSDPQCEATGGVCQTNMALVEGAKATWWFSVGSKSAENLVVDVAGATSSNGSASFTLAADNRGGWGTVLAAYLRDTAGGDGQGGGEAASSGAFRGSGLGLGLIVMFVVMLSIGI
jgi:glucan 1,3-beta-glucosidase